MEAKFHNPDVAYAFVLAGHAIFTLRSVKSGVRYTYRVIQAEEEPNKSPLWFVGVLTGSDNEASYSYIGVVSNNQFRLTKKSKMSADSQSVVAFKWVFDKLVKQILPEGVEIWHAGHCGRCGRTLTVPESIENGFGPECVQIVAAKMGPGKLYSFPSP